MENYKENLANGVSIININKSIKVENLKNNLKSKM